MEENNDNNFRKNILIEIRKKNRQLKRVRDIKERLMKIKQNEMEIAMAGRSEH